MTGARERWRRLRVAFDRGEPVVLRARTPGMNACAAFHPRAYMEAQLASRFDSVRFYGDGASLPSARTCTSREWGSAQAAVPV